MTATEQLYRLLEGLEHEGTTVMDLVCGGASPEPWTLYPGEHGIFDRRTKSQFYYHVHAAAPHEAGHFHTVHLFPDRTAHLVGISMAPTGWPQALLTLNLWAVGDAYETSANLKRCARRFLIDERCGDPRLIRFVNLVFWAFLPEIERLQEGKIEALVAHRIAHPAQNPLENRDIEVLSRVEIDGRARSRIETSGVPCQASGNKSSPPSV